LPNKKDFGTIKKEGFIFKRIISGKLRRYFSFKNLISPFQVLIGTVQAFIFICKIKPNLVFLKGGYGALPVGIIALIKKIPIVLHESDVFPGLITRIFNRWAKLTLISFEETRNYLLSGFSSVHRQAPSVYLSGNPVRNFKCTKEDIIKAREKLKINPDKKMIFVLGGSQGSREINELIFDLLCDLTVNFSLIHIVGKRNFSEFKEKFTKKYNHKIQKHNYNILSQNYKAYAFMKENDLKTAYCASDIIISRAGASIIFEIAQAGKPSILIPLINSASDHQKKNAYAYMKTGSCLVVERPNLKKNIFLKNLNNLLSNEKELSLMAKSAHEFAKPDAAKDIAGLIQRFF
jgi:UDP-N-acetylglucosamine--N-acetylmuramyl-(pentapeptide) pyrophosphoryl-undecaprenol N-acetylglucosamine transferase